MTAMLAALILTIAVAPYMVAAVAFVLGLCFVVGLIAEGCIMAARAIRDAIDNEAQKQ